MGTTSEYDFVFIISDLATGGGQEATLNQAKALERRGVTTLVIALNDLPMGFQPETPFLVLKGHRVKWIRVLKQAVWLRKNFAENLAIIICVMEYAIILAWLSGLSFQAIFHSDLNWKYRGFKRWLLHFFINIPSNLKSFVSTPSIRSGLHPLVQKKVSILKNPIPTLVNIKPRSLDCPYIIFVGRLVDVKDPLWALGVFKESGLSGKCRLVFVGEGPLKDTLKTAAKEADLGEAIVLTGWIDYPDEYIAGADMMIVSSRSEAYPTVIIKAFQLGIPVFACRSTSGYEELLADGRGVIAKSGETSKVGEELYRFYADNKGRKQFVQQSRVFIQNEALPDYGDYLLQQIVK